MRSVTTLAIAAATALLGITAATAADLPAMPPIVEEFSGWYLRGDIGMSNQDVKSLFNVLYNAPNTTVTNTDLGFDSAPIFGVGVGYQFNHWLRADITGEYRGKANFHGLDIVSSGGFSSNEYHASKSEWVGLVNLYADLGTWWQITPFVGAGVGFARNTISSFTDICTTCAGGSVAYGGTASKWNFAWAIHAGLAYQVTPSFTVELAYRYLSLGDAQSGDEVTFNGINAVNNPMIFNDLTSHDVKLGVRWMLVPEPLHASPLMRRG